MRFLKSIAAGELLADGTSVATLSPSTVDRMLRLTPLPVLVRRRSTLVALLLRAPHLHDGLRTTWGRQDPLLTAQIFRWVEQGRLHHARTAGTASATTNWMRDRELATT